jgi:hypothetical protein
MPLAEFHPTIQRWFENRFGEATEPQRLGWPAIRSGKHTLISAPTGTGKTIAGYLSAIDSLARQGANLKDETQVLYLSPLRALSNDVQKNLQGPLDELARMDPRLPEIRVLVRTGDTPAKDRAAMLRKPPHILVTTPESMYILLTSQRGREMLRTVKTVIVDEFTRSPATSAARICRSRSSGSRNWRDRFNASAFLLRRSRSARRRSSSSARIASAKSSTSAIAARWTSPLSFRRRRWRRFARTSSGTRFTSRSRS